MNKKKTRMVLSILLYFSSINPEWFWNLLDTTVRDSKRNLATKTAIFKTWQRDLLEAKKNKLNRASIEKNLKANYTQVVKLLGRSRAVRSSAFRMGKSHVREKAHDRYFLGMSDDTFSCWWFHSPASEFHCPCFWRDFLAPNSAVCSRCWTSEVPNRWLCCVPENRP